MPIPTGTAAISFSQLRDEMNAGSGGAYPATPGTFNLNDATFRSRLTDTAVNGALSLSSLRGNAYQRFTIAADYNTTYDIRTALVATGWTTTSKGSADVVVNAGIYVSSASTGAYGMDTGGPWPGSSTIVVYNNGFILGMGGAGGAGGEDDFNNAQPGNAGGPALLAQRAMTLVNAGTVGGGGGGGGGGDGTTGITPLSPPFSPLPFNNGGGGGGGGRTGRTNSAAGGPGPADGPNANPGGAGQAGTITAGGTGGPGAGSAGAGGTGGNWGTAGNNGGIGNAPAQRAGGAAGISVQGWSVVTAPAPTGTILGPTAG